MRWFLGPLEKRLRERRGRRPARPAARPALSLERLEDRRLLSTTAALQPAPLVDANQTAPAAAVGSATPWGPAGGTTRASGALSNPPPTPPVQVTRIADPTSPNLNWTVAAVYQVQAPTPNDLSNPPPTSPQKQPASQTAKPSDGGTASPGTSSATPTAASGSALAQSTTTDPGQDQHGKAPPQGAAPAPQPPTSPQWRSAEYYAIHIGDASLFLRVSAALSPATPPPPPPAADAGGSTSPTTPGGTMGATTAAEPGNTDAAAPLTGDAATATGRATAQAGYSILTVEISYAVGPRSESVPAAGASTAPSDGATSAVLSLAVTPSVAGLGFGVTVAEAGGTAGDREIAVVLSIADGTPASAASPVPMQASGQGATLSFQLLIVFVPSGAGFGGRGAAISPMPAPMPAAAPDATSGVVMAAATPAAAPGPSAAAGPAAAQPDGPSTAPAPTGPALDASAVADLVLAGWTEPGAGPGFAGAIALYSAAEWQAAASPVHAGEMPVLTAAQWAALSETIKQAMIAGAPADAGLPDSPTSAAVPLSEGGVGAASAAAAAARADRHWLWLGAPFVMVGGVLLPAFGLGRSGAPAAAAGAAAGAAASPVALVVAESVRKSTESLTGLVRGLYRALLGRNPENGEEQGWVGALVAGQTEEQFLEAFLATAEFTQRAAALGGPGTADEQYLRGLFLALLLRPATAQEVGDWLAALPDLGRDGVVACLVRSNEFRALQVQGFYQQVYGQAADAADAAAWAASPLHLLAIRAAISEPRP